MTLLLLVRHGRTTANASGVLAGWTPGVSLDDKGRDQAAALGARLADVPLAAVVSSPLDRCVQTSQFLLDARPEPVKMETEERMGECRYGDWTGRPLKELAEEPLWRTVQDRPSAAVFPGPGGEALRTTQARAVDAVYDWNARIAAEHGDHAAYVMCSHGDVIKAVVADALGMHLDLFQRINVDPCSLTVISYTERRPFVLRLNDTGGDVGGLVRAPEQGRSGDAAVGGGAGSS